MNNNEIKPIRAFLVPTHNKKIEDLKINASRNHKITFFKTDIVKIAISELLENVTNDNDLEALLKKYNYI